MSLCVKIIDGLCYVHSSMFLHTVKHTGVLALEIDFSSCLILTYIARARVGVKEVGRNGVYSLNLEVEL